MNQNGINKYIFLLIAILICKIRRNTTYDYTALTKSMV